MLATLWTERLILRSFFETDLDEFFEYARSLHVGPSAGWRPHASRDESLMVLLDFIQKQEVWAIVDRHDRKVIGSIGLHPDRRRLNRNCRVIGYALAEPYWGHGLMTEAARRVLEHAFCDLALDLVAVCHFPFNVRSRRIIEKCGFVHEGTLRQATLLYDGTVYDDVCYSLTRDEYLVRANALAMQPDARLDGAQRLPSPETMPDV